MRMPGANEAWIPAPKIDDYLLNLQHPEGGGKAKFFQSVGFLQGSSASLASALLRVAAERDVLSQTSTEYGTKFRIAGTIDCPNGTQAEVLTVWMKPAGARPWLVTAYPWRR